MTKEGAFSRAETIFQFGESIPEAAAQAVLVPVARLAVGMSDGLSKLATHALRGHIDRWFEAQQITPRAVGKFEDSALLSLFAAQGMGVFPVAALGADGMAASLRLRLLGRSEGLHEEIYALRSRRSLHHPLVLQILDSAGEITTSGPQ